MRELTQEDFDNNAPTDADLWLKLYDKFGSRMTAYTDSGHLENVIDVLIDRLENAEKATEERIIKLIEDIPTKGILTEDGREILSIELKDIIKLIKGEK